MNDFDKNAFLSGNFTILSTNTDRRGKAFVSTMEHNLFPVFGTQWHPEKNAFEFGTNADGTPFEVIPHSRQAIEVPSLFSALCALSALSALCLSLSLHYLSTWICRIIEAVIHTCLPMSMLVPILPFP